MMILKVNDTNKYTIRMELIVDCKAEEIEIHIRHHDKRHGTICGYDYSASEFPAALAKFKELEDIYTEEM